MILLLLCMLFSATTCELFAGSFEVAAFADKENVPFNITQSYVQSKKKEAHVVIIGMLGGMQTASKTTEDQLLEIEEEHCAVMDLHKAIEANDLAQVKALLDNFLRAFDLDSEILKIAEKSEFKSLKECRQAAIIHILNKRLKCKDRFGKNAWYYAKNSDIFELMLSYGKVS